MTSQRIARYMTISAVLVLIGFTLPPLSDFLSVQFWRHDSIYYLSSYDGKLNSEGRWLNHILFSWLKHLPAWLSLIISYGAIGYFSFICSYRFNKDAWFSLLLALAVINIPMLRMQLEWPTTLLPAFLLVLFAPLLSRRLADYVFFPAYGVLLFGSFSSLYFLLPFLYVHSITPKMMLRILLLWVISFVLGYAIAQLVVLLTSGEPIEVAGWRNPNPVHSTSSLFTNIQTMWGGLRSHSQFMIGTITTPLLLLTLVWSLLDEKPAHRGIITFVTAIVFLAPYVTTIPYGIVVSGRTAFISMTALLLGLFLHNRDSAWYRTAGTGLLLTIGILMSQLTNTYTQWYKGLTDSIATQVKQKMPLPADKTGIVYLHFTNDQWQKFTTEQEAMVVSNPLPFSEGFAPIHYARSLLISLGYSHIEGCDGANTDKCNATHPLKPSNTKGAKVHAEVIGEHDILLSILGL